VEFVLLLRSALVLLGPAARRLPLRHRGLCSARRREQEFAARTSAVLAAARELPLARTGTASAPGLLPAQGITVSAKARAARGRRAGIGRPAPLLALTAAHPTTTERAT